MKILKKTKIEPRPAGSWTATASGFRTVFVDFLDFVDFDF